MLLSKSRNFDFEMEVMTEAKARGDVTFMNSLTGGHQVVAAITINNSPDLEFHHAKTGSVPFAWQFKSLVKDGEWFKLRVRLEKCRLKTWVNEKLVTEQLGWRGEGFGVAINSFAEPKSKILLRSIRVQLLPDTPRTEDADYPTDDFSEQRWQLGNFPLINYHIHLKGDLTLEKAGA